MSPLKRFILMLLLTLMWSPSFLFIKLAVEELPPLTIVAARVFLASLVLFLILYARGGRLPSSPKFWGLAALTAFFSSAAPFYLLTFAEQTIESALAAILNGTTPMFTAILAQLFL